MCGIAGVVDPAGPDPRDVERALACLEHRGPDATGLHARGAAVIGQNRLAVIDLVTGDPPIASEDGAIGVVLNGEVYNYRALRDELRRDGHRLATTGDTEVIAHLAESLDPVALARRLQGMFAFAVWDARRERLVIGRDRLGKKPLYYWAGAGRLVFASEIKAVLAAPRVPRRLDPGAIPAHLAFGYVPTPRTFFDGVRSLPPGHVLVAQRGELRVTPYWEPVVPTPGGAPRLEVSLERAADEVRGRLTRAVQRRLVADVPVGALLSGGVDSTAVVGTMAALSDRPVKTFTIGFEGPPGFDERPYARIAARRFATEHHEAVVAPGAAVDLIERLVWHHDQPFGDSSALPTFLACELAREHVTVALGGDGGDELFAGYARFTAALAAGRLRRLLARPGPAAAGLIAALPAPLRRRASAAQRFLARAGLGLPDAYLAWVGCVEPEWRDALVGAGHDVDGEARRIWARSRGADTLDRLLDLNLRTYLVDDLLPKVDRTAMAHGLEVRSPLLDHELVELALRLPRAARVQGMARKRVLRAAVADLVPREILARGKQGFGVPVDHWFRTSLRGYLEGMLGVPDACVRAHVAPEALDALIAAHVSGRAEHGHALWALLTLEVFLRREGW